MPKGAFEIPKIEEVVTYMTVKFKDWPDSFCEYYANRFWNHYQSNGWLVSGKSKMKDWKAAVNGQWSTIKFREDQEMLSRALNEETIKALYAPKPTAKEKTTPPAETVVYLDEILQSYAKHPTLVPKERLASCYDWLKSNRLIRITPEQKAIAIQAGTSDIVNGKALVVQFVFDYMTLNLKTFNQLLNAVL